MEEVSSLVVVLCSVSFFFFSSRRRHTRFDCDWSSDVCSSDLISHAGFGDLTGRTAPSLCPASTWVAGRKHESRSFQPPVYVAATQRLTAGVEIGRASCRERV